MFLNYFWILKWYILIQLNYLWADRDHEHVHIKVHMPHLMRKHTHVRTVSKHHFHPKKITKIHTSLNTDIDSSAILPYINSPINEHHFISPTFGHSIPSGWNLDASAALSTKNTKYLTPPILSETDWTNNYFPSSGKFSKPIINHQFSKYKKIKRPTIPASYKEDFLFQHGQQQYDEDKLTEDDSIESETNSDINGFDEINDSYTVSSYNNPKWIPSGTSQLSYMKTKGNNWQPQTMLASSEWDDNLPNGRESITSEYQSYYGKLGSPNYGLMSSDLMNSEMIPSPTAALEFNNKIRNIKKNKWSKKKLKSNRNRYQNRMKF